MIFLGLPFYPASSRVPCGVGTSRLSVRTGVCNSGATKPAANQGKARMKCRYCGSENHRLATTREELLECRDRLHGEPNPYAVKLVKIQRVAEGVTVHTNPLRYVEAVGEILGLLKED